MATSTLSGGEPALLKQCLDFCQALASMGQTISFSLTLGSTFSFNLDNKGKANSPVGKMTKKKKLSPSTLRRNLLRKEQFLKQKSETSRELEATSLTEANFHCEHCASSFQTENGLKIHVGKSHKALKSSLPPEMVRENSQETSLTVSPLRNTRREEKETEGEEEAPPLLEEDIVTRHFSIESLCNASRFTEHLESDLNRDVVKHFKVHEKEKLSNSSTSYEVVITGVKGSRVLWPKSKDVCSNIMLIK